MIMKSSASPVLVDVLMPLDANKKKPSLNTRREFTIPYDRMLAEERVE